MKKKEKKNKKQAEETKPKRQLWKSIVLFCVVLMLLSSCIAKCTGADSLEADDTESAPVMLSLSETMSQSTHIIAAVYLGESDGEMLFRPATVYKGTLEDDETEQINVLYDDADAEEIGFVEGTEYLIFLDKTVSVYFDHTRFYLQSINLITEETDFYADYLAQAEENAAASEGEAGYSGTAFTTATDPDEIAAFASNIFVITIDSIYGTGTATNVYNCTVTQVLRGAQVPDEDDDVTIPFFVDTVTVGEEYVVLLGDATDTAPIYTIAAKTGAIYTLEQAQAIDALAALLDE